MTIKIVAAPDKFKGTLTAAEAAVAIERGVARAISDALVVRVPVADGGEGTLAAMLAAADGRAHAARVMGPLGEPVEAHFGVLADGTAVIEMAEASGLALVPRERRDPTLTTTYGTGELIRAALDLGSTSCIVGVGGSATCDAGVGMGQALGVGAYDADGLPIGYGGGELARIARLDLTTLDPRARSAAIRVATDVVNPLTGPNGAAYVYAPQKGASPEAVALLERGLANFAAVALRDIGVALTDLPGAGAAGGLAAGLVAFLGAELKAGAELIIEAVGLPAHLEDADLVITGEGRIDRQSAYGKAPVAVARLAARRDVPVVAIAGAIGDGFEAALAEGIARIYALDALAGSAEAAEANAREHVERAAYLAAADFLAGRV